MVLHAGIAYSATSPFSHYITFYDTETTEVTEYDLGSKFSGIETLFKSIESKINGKLGCLCIAFILAENDFRKLFYDFAIKIGFEKVKIIEHTTALYFYMAYYSNYVPKNGDVIWIYGNNRYWYVWQIKNYIAKFILSKYCLQNLSKKIVEEILNKIDLPPNVILYRNEFDEASAKEIFPKCEFFKCSDDIPEFNNSKNFWNTSCYKGALIQARIMANDAAVMIYNANSTLPDDLCLITKNINDIKWIWKKLPQCKTKKDGKTSLIVPKRFQKRAFLERKIKGIQRYLGSGETLPITKTAIIRSTNNKNILSVITGTEEINHSICLPLNKKIAATLNVDESGISHINVKVLDKIKSKLFDYNKKYFIPQKVAIDWGRAIGIDLGTTRCCAAVVRRNGFETVALDNIGERLLPSYVAYDEKKEKCGQIVLTRLRHHSKSTVFDSKRIIGKNVKEISIDQSWPFKVIQDKNLKLEHLNEDQLLQFKLLENNDTFIKIESKNGQIFKHPEEISAVLLKHMKQKVEEFQGGRRNRVMITIPTTFTDSQKDSTCAAAILAGFEMVDLMPEPIAAAFSYFIDQPIRNSSFNFLLFDLGGGTLDVCLLKCEKNQIKILSQYGNTNLGGRDFDNILIEYFSQKLINEFGIKDLNLKKYKLMIECQNIKEGLSTNDKEFLDVEEFDLESEGVIEITRKKFEELSAELLEKAKNCISSALDNCKYDQIDKILLVGGGSRMPMIKNLLKTLFNKAEFCCTKHPDEIVAVGAAYHAFYLESLLRFKHGETSKPLKNYKRGKRKNLDPIIGKEEEEESIWENLKLLSLSKHGAGPIKPV